jgi:adenosylhomocysteine nucleosidase
MIGVLGAMEAEVGLLAEGVDEATTSQVGSRRFLTGTLSGQPVVMGVSGFGKVAAASTVTTMLDRFGADVVLFAGVAGGLDPGVSRGDVVVADALTQHDFDASPIFPRFVIPSLHEDRIPADTLWTERVLAAARMTEARVHCGLVLTGDRFINGADERHELRSLFPDALAVEMEGAAVAQVCAERGVPFAVVRAISDSANEEAATDFVGFVEQVSAPLLAEIVSKLVAGL